MKNFKHELHEQKLAHHFDLNADLFFLLVDENFKVFLSNKYTCLVEVK